MLAAFSVPQPVETSEPFEDEIEVETSFQLFDAAGEPTETFPISGRLLPGIDDVNAYAWWLTNSGTVVVNFTGTLNAKAYRYETDETDPFEDMPKVGVPVQFSTSGQQLFDVSTPMVTPINGDLEQGGWWIDRFAVAPAIDRLTELQLDQFAPLMTDTPYWVERIGTERLIFAGFENDGLNSSDDSTSHTLLFTDDRLRVHARATIPNEVNVKSVAPSGRRALLEAENGTEAILSLVEQGAAPAQAFQRPLASGPAMQRIRDAGDEENCFFWADDVIVDLVADHAAEALRIYARHVPVDGPEVGPHLIAEVPCSVTDGIYFHECYIHERSGWIAFYWYGGRRQFGLLQDRDVVLLVHLADTPLALMQRPEPDATAGADVAIEHRLAKSYEAGTYQLGDTSETYGFFFSPSGHRLAITSDTGPRTEIYDLDALLPSR